MDAHAERSRVTLGLARTLLGLLGLFTLIWLTAYNLQNVEAFSLANFLSLFTIESNIIAAPVLIFAGVCAIRGVNPNYLTAIRGFAVLVLVLTSLVYVIFLGDQPARLPVNLPWGNITLHFVIPAAVVADWFFDRRTRPLGLRAWVTWLMLVFLYPIYTWVRGALTGWYPYPFLTPVAPDEQPTNVAWALIVIGCCLISLLLVLTTQGGSRPAQAEVEGEGSRVPWLSGV